MADRDDVLAGQRASWDGLAAGWEKWDGIIQAQLAPVSAAMIESLEVSDEQEHLDVASGTGEPGLAVARLAVKGRVVLTDLSAEMLQVAARRAAELGLDAVETRACSADALPFPDASFDSVSVRFGYMFLPDLAAATAELARVLRPGGRLCASVWVRPDDNPWTGILLRAVGAEVRLEPPAPDAPSMFRCAAPGHLQGLFEAAGLRDVTERDVDVDLVTRTTEEYWDVMSEHVSLAVAALRQVDAQARQRIRRAVLDEAEVYVVGDEVRLPGAARCTTGTRS